jgi:hypothetical protein
VIVGSVGVERLEDGARAIGYLDARLRAARNRPRAGRDGARVVPGAAVGRLILWSDTRFDQAHRLYERMGFRRTCERILPADLNQTREYGFERPV